MISWGVEISIAGCGEEMARAISCSTSFFLLFSLYHVFIVTVQELACSASYGVNKTSWSKNQKTNVRIRSSQTRVKYSTHHHLTANKWKDNHKGS